MATPLLDPTLLTSARDDVPSLPERTVRIRRLACALLGGLLVPPDEDHLARLLLARAMLRAPHVPADAADALARYAALRDGQSAGEVQECYTRTFELSPRCAPYLSVHLFGAESFERSQLMTGLLETYQKIQFTGRGAELPDHLGVVLRAAPLFDLEVWLELETLCLRPALDKMLERLDGVPVVPWRYLVEAVALILAHSTGCDPHEEEDDSHA